MNSPALERPALIDELAARFGTQCVVVGIDVDGNVEDASTEWRVVADSGTVKTPAWRRVTSHLFRAQKRLLQEHRAALAAYEAELAAHQEARKKAAKGIGRPASVNSPA